MMYGYWLDRRGEAHLVKTNDMHAEWAAELLGIELNPLEKRANSDKYYDKCDRILKQMFRVGWVRVIISVGDKLILADNVFQNKLDASKLNRKQKAWLRDKSIETGYPVTGFTRRDKEINLDEDTFPSFKDIIMESQEVEFKWVVPGNKILFDGELYVNDSHFDSERKKFSTKLPIWLFDVDFLYLCLIEIWPSDVDKVETSWGYYGVMGPSGVKNHREIIVYPPDYFGKKVGNQLHTPTVFGYYVSERFIKYYYSLIKKISKTNNKVTSFPENVSIGKFVKDNNINWAGISYVERGTIKRLKIGEKLPDLILSGNLVYYATDAVKKLIDDEFKKLDLRREEGKIL